MKNIDSDGLFNSPLEVGIRATILLNQLYPEFVDIQRLVYLDYLLVHSGDFQGGPESLHKNTPLRSGEIFVRRETLRKAIELFISYGMIECEFGQLGIRYRASEKSQSFVSQFSSSYVADLRTVARWVRGISEQYSEDQLGDYFNVHLQSWGAEFEYGALVMEDTNG